MDEPQALIWAESKGYGHFVGPDGEGICGSFLDPDAPTIEVADIHARPYGAITCPTCHGLVKQRATAGVTPDALPGHGEAIDPTGAAMEAAGVPATVVGAPVPVAATFDLDVEVPDLTPAKRERKR